MFWVLTCTNIFRKKFIKIVYNLSWEYTLPELWGWGPYWNKIKIDTERTKRIRNAEQTNKKPR